MTLVLAIDLGGTKVEAAVVGADGLVRTESRTRRPTGRDVTPDILRTALTAVIAGALAAIGDERISAVGIGTAGPFRAGGAEIAPVNMRGLHGFALRDAVAAIVREITGAAVPVAIGHDGGCLAVAEAWRGATVGSRASMSIVVSTGIGGGIVMDGSLMSGASGNAGHLGQTHVRGEDLTLEEIASGPASVGWARARGWTGETGEALAADAAAGDKTARAAIERSARAVGQALADAATLLDLEIIAIGGGFSHAAPDYIDLVQASLHATGVLEPMRDARVVPSGLHGDGPLIGAAAMALRAGSAAS